MRTNVELNYKIVGMLDDNSSKMCQRLNGIPVLGLIDKVNKISSERNVYEIIISISFGSKGEICRMVKLFQKSTKINILPGVYKLIGGRVTVNQIREVKIEDLLGRQPVHLD